MDQGDGCRIEADIRQRRVEEIPQKSTQLRLHPWFGQDFRVMKSTTLQDRLRPARLARSTGQGWGLESMLIKLRGVSRNQPTLTDWRCTTAYDEMPFFERRQRAHGQLNQDTKACIGISMVKDKVRHRTKWLKLSILQGASFLVGRNRSGAQSRSLTSLQSGPSAEPGSSPHMINSYGDCRCRSYKALLLPKHTLSVVRLFHCIRMLLPPIPDPRDTSLAN